MDNAYETVRPKHKTTSAEKRSRHPVRRGKKVPLGRREKRRLAQLGVCVVLFLAVYLGKGIFPEQMLTVRQELTELMGVSTDFETAFSNLGRSISKGEPITEALGGLWVDVFNPTYRWEVYQKTVSDTQPYQAVRAFAAAPMEVLAQLEEETPPQEEQLLPAQPTPVAVEESEESEERAVEHMDYDGPALPGNTTMDKYALALETISPVDGTEGAWVSSPFGWRDHPVNGENLFHYGVDLAVNTGTPVKAFADGVVEYTGESEIYGLYFQIQHPGGVKSFYAHCSEILVRQGQEVKLWETVALSGATGNVTGPHLHFELRLDDLILNPLYYIQGG